MDIARTIYEQLGGRTFAMMTGAKHFTSSDKALAFRLPARSTKQGINQIRITLDQGTDTYNVIFNRIHGTKVTLLADYSGVYCDQLVDLFTEKTGLYTTLK